jgi:hypothetical protein
MRAVGVKARLNNSEEIPMRASAWFLGGLVVGAVLVQTSDAQTARGAA